MRNRNGQPSPWGEGCQFDSRFKLQLGLLSAYQLPRLDQHEVGMVNASLDVAGDRDEPPLRVQDFQ